MGGVGGGGEGGSKPLLNTMWDNEILMFINETQLIERRMRRQMKRRRRIKCVPPQHSKGEILRVCVGRGCGAGGGVKHSPHKKGFI